VVPQSLLDKYELKAGNAILAEEKHASLYQARRLGVAHALRPGSPGRAAR
jgi:hypothetical protein